jgi:hypothetical protein
MQLPEIVQFLIANGYIAMHKGLYKFTAKFNREVVGLDKGLVPGPGGVLMVREPELPKQVSWQQLYMRFIIEAKVPRKVTGPSGDAYQTNAYSEGGMKAFRKAIENERVQYEKLVAATILYYKSFPYPVAIGRYMEEGVWRTGYSELERSIETGTIDEHVKTSTHEPYSKWRI